MVATWDIIQTTILYLGFLVLIIWRGIFPWRAGNHWTKRFNHFTLLYLLLCGLYIFELVEFILTVAQDVRGMNEIRELRAKGDVLMPHGKREWPILWLRALVWAVPFVVPFIIALCWSQSVTHLKEIYQDTAQWSHDRVICILALPAVYAVVVMTGLVRVYACVVEDVMFQQTWTLNASQNSVDYYNMQIQKSLSFARYETCIYVGDLYEAFALYQFGVLTVDLLANALPEEKTGGDENESMPTRTLSINAVSNVMWVGTGLFICVNLIQAGWALYMWFFDNPGENWDHFQYTLSKFSYAGLVASAAAIYNVHVVESTFGHFIRGYSPYLKFLSVKILVFFAFWQSPALAVLSWLKITNMTEIQLKLFQAALLVFECFAAACVHLIAWGAQEPWFAYADEKTPLMDGSNEKTPLLDTGRESSGAPRTNSSLNSV